MKGFSGNYDGRPSKDRTIPSPESYRDVIYDLSEYKVTVTIEGKERKVTLVVANLLTLGAKGAAGDIAAARTFVATLRMAVESELRMMYAMEKKFQGVDPLFLREKDPIERRIQEQIWEDLVVAPMGGVRRRKTEPFPPPARRRRAIRRY